MLTFSASLLLVVSLLGSAWFVQGKDKDSRPYQRMYKTQPVLEEKVTLTEAQILALKPTASVKPNGTEIVESADAVVALSLPIGGTVIGGTKAVRGQFPWMAGLLIDASSICGGSLISSTWILTAAHCVKGSFSWQIYLDTIDFKAPRIRRSSVVGIPHPSYNPNNLNNDLGLVRFILPVLKTSTLAPIRLPKWSQIAETFTGTKPIISGFGKISDAIPFASQYLQYAPLTVISTEQCATVYGTDVIRSSTLCTLDGTKKAICSGDSGGPLVLKEADGMYTLIGVVSFNSEAGCETGSPSGYSRVTSYLQFISSYTGIYVRP